MAASPRTPAASRRSCTQTPRARSPASSSPSPAPARADTAAQDPDDAPRAVPFRLWVIADVAVAGGDEAVVARLRTIAETGGEEVALYLRHLSATLIARVVTATAPTGAAVFTREPILSYPPAFRGLRGLHRPGGEEDEDPKAPPARGGLWLPPLRSRAVHSVEEARAAREDGVDLAIFGHVYDTPSKPGTPGRGLAMLREACAAAAPVPVFALGGVTAARVPEMRAAGARGVGTLRELLAAEDGKTAAEAFLRALRAPG